MSGLRDPPSEDGASVDEPPTPYEHLLVAEAGDVVGRWASWIARKFPRHVRKNGLMSQGDFEAIGHQALYRAARVYHEDQNPEFSAFASCYVRGAMLDAIDDLHFHERMSHAAAGAEDNHGMSQTGGDYNVMKHDAAEAKRRYQAFANGVLAATFAATMAQAEQHLDEAEVAVRRDFEQARAILQSALARMEAENREMLALVYCDRMDLTKACALLGIPYGTARARHARALALLRDLLVEEDIKRAPRPLAVHTMGEVFGARAPPQNDTGADEEQ
jgi:RNA polymerase sigma factor (sigma-70 family)